MIYAIYQSRGGTALLCLLAMMLGGCATSQKQQTQDDKLAATHYELGKDALIKGMLPKAFEELMKSDKLHPNQPETHDALAYAWLLRGDLKQSELHYKQALKHGAGSATRTNYANLLNKSGRHQEAEKQAREALDDPRYPNQDLAFINLGDALLGQQKNSEALQAYRQAQIFSPDSIRPKIRVAGVYLKENRLNEAHLLYQSLYSKSGSSRTIVEGLLSVLKKKGLTMEARHLLASFSEHNLSAIDRAWAMNEIEKLR